MSYSKLYYALLGVSFAGFIGSCYKLYKLFSGKEQFIEEVSLIEDNSISSEIKSDALTIEKALKLIAILKTKTEDYLNEKCPNIINLRRYYLKIDEEQYLKICDRIMITNDDAYRLINKYILETYGNSIEEIVDKTKSFSYFELEENLIPKLNIKIKSLIDKNTIIQAFVFYESTFIDLVKKEQDHQTNEKFANFTKELLLYKLSILKFKAEDNLFLNFGITEIQLKKYIYEYKLHLEQNIKKIMLNILEYEDLYTNSC